MKEKNLLHPTAMYDILTRMIFQGWKACEALSYNSARDSKTNNQNISSIGLGYLKYFISWGDILNFLNTNLGVRLNVKDDKNYDLYKPEKYNMELSFSKVQCCPGMTSAFFRPQSQLFQFKEF